MRTQLTLAALLTAALLVACDGATQDAPPPPAPTPESTGDVPAAKQPAAGSLEAIVMGQHRRPEDRARDKYRHPEQTLAFFGLKPDMNVVEIWPGGGWYTDIIAPYVAGKGTYTAAIFDEGDGTGYGPKLNKALKDKIAANPDVYGTVSYTTLTPATIDLVTEGSADMVLTFRNVHNWMSGGYADKVFAAMFRALKPGGILGVEEHRGDPELPQDPLAATGYVTEEHVIRLAEAAGFQAAEHSEINANPLDTRDHPKGVWTLPPTLRLGDQDREKYIQIGESDRMTLKFVKPATTGMAAAESP
ncbi:methyltransferase [Emcibacter sp. SYSU 3D8]|uniref:class I SAM-dependent methyltransferase n=1 Tax=Emcibacter sp. SYSU 3D8 TaxID=3133969 RepID=UPI0031FF2CDF